MAVLILNLTFRMSAKGEKLEGQKGSGIERAQCWSPVNRADALPVSTYFTLGGHGWSDLSWLSIIIGYEEFLSP